MKKIILIIFLLAIVGCVSPYQIKFDSVPQSADVICNGRNMGKTPIVLVNDSIDLKIHSGKTFPTGCYARWSSGDTQHYGDYYVFPEGGTVKTVSGGNQSDYIYDQQYKTALENQRLEKQRQELIREQIRAQQQLNYELSRPRRCFRDFLGNYNCF